MDTPLTQQPSDKLEAKVEPFNSSFTLNQGKTLTSLVGLLSSPKTQELRDQGKFGYVAQNLEFEDTDKWTIYISVDIYNNYHVHVKNKPGNDVSLQDRTWGANQLAKHFKEQWDREFIMTTCDVNNITNNQYVEQIGFELIGEYDDEELNKTYNIYRLEYKEVN